MRLLVVQVRELRGDSDLEGVADGVVQDVVIALEWCRRAKTRLDRYSFLPFFVLMLVVVLVVTDVTVVLIERRAES